MIRVNKSSWKNNVYILAIVSALVHEFGGLCAEGSKLTVEETLGAVFLPIRGATALANPGAKSILYKVLEDNALKPYHKNVYPMLGYIGDGTDATNLELRLMNNYHGTLSIAEWDGVNRILLALSMMSRRGIGEASAILEKMTSPAYWKDIRFHSVLGSNPPLGVANEMMITALYLYAESGKEDWRQKVQAFKDRVQDAEARKTLEWRLDPERIARHLKEFREPKPVTIPPAHRQLLAAAFNGDFNKPGPSPEEKLAEVIEKSRVANESRDVVGVRIATNAVQPVQGAELVALSKEAQKFFERIADYLLNEQYEECAKTLADNGKPLLPPEKRNEQMIAATVAKFRRMSRDVEATKRVISELQAQGINYGQPQGESRSDDTLVVKIPCLGSESVAAQHLPQQMETQTKDAEGRLVIYMIKKDGQWYWNPFGW